MSQRIKKFAESVLFDGLIIIAGVLSIGAIIFLVYLFSIYAMSASGIFR
jgi:hypothetical protein